MPASSQQFPEAKELRWGPLSEARVVAFENLSWAAEQTLPYLCRPRVALSGGSTYAQLFQEWRHLRPPCADTQFFPVDERMVPFDDPKSNWGMAYREFLTIIGRENDKANHPTSLRHFEEILHKAFSRQKPVFDTVFLGMGDDGHTASLFPHSQDVDDTHSLVLQTRSPKPPFDRLTLGTGVIAQAQSVVVVIAGKDKKPAMQALLRQDQDLPIVKVLRLCSDSLLLVEKGLLE